MGRSLRESFASAEATIFWHAPKYGKNAPTQKRRVAKRHCNIADFGRHKSDRRNRRIPSFCRHTENRQNDKYCCRAVPTRGRLTSHICVVLTETIDNPHSSIQTYTLSVPPRLNLNHLVPLSNAAVKKKVSFV